MAENNKELATENDIFDLELTDAEENNKRTAIRYVRQDISATLIKKRIFGSSEVLVKLIDISSKGALIAYPEKLRINGRVTINLIFKDGKKFSLPATIVHRGNKPQVCYGLKFSSCNDELGEHLLSSQSDLVFK